MHLHLAITTLSTSRDIDLVLSNIIFPSPFHAYHLDSSDVDLADCLVSVQVATLWVDVYCTC